MVTTVTLLIWRVDNAIITEIVAGRFAFDSQKQDSNKLLRKAWTVTTSTRFYKFVLLDLQMTSSVGIRIFSLFILF